MSMHEQEFQPSATVRRAAEKVRLDLKQEVISINQETRTVLMRMEPDPRRYDRIEKDEPGTWYLDRYFHTAFRFEDFADQMAGLPIYASDRTVDSASQYAAERRVALQRELQTGPDLPHLP